MERVIRAMNHRPLQPGIFLDLDQVLPAFSPDAHAWRWAIRSDPETVCASAVGLNLAHIREQIEQSPCGLILSFEELEQFANGSPK